MKQQIGLLAIAAALLINAMFYGCAHRYRHIEVEAGYGPGKHDGLYDTWTGKIKN